MSCILADVNKTIRPEVQHELYTDEKIEQVTDTTMVVGIDIGSQTHYARAFDNRGRELTKRVFSFKNDIEGFNSFYLWTETLRRDKVRLK